MAGTGSPGAACRLRAVGASGSLLLLLLLLSQVVGLDQTEPRRSRDLIVSTEIPVGSIDPAAIDLAPLVNTLINSTQSGPLQLFSLLSVTSYSSLELHKLTLLIYNISSVSVESKMFHQRFCYCVSNKTSDLTDFTAILLDVMSNSSYLHEIFKSTSILSVSQKNETDCIYICVMAGQADRELPKLWDSDLITPLFNQTIIEDPNRSGNLSLHHSSIAWQQMPPPDGQTPSTELVQDSATTVALDPTSGRTPPPPPPPPPPTSPPDDAAAPTPRDPPTPTPSPPTLRTTVTTVTRRLTSRTAATRPAHTATDPGMLSMTTTTSTTTSTTSTTTPPTTSARPTPASAAPITTERPTVAPPLPAVTSSQTAQTSPPAVRPGQLTTARKTTTTAKKETTNSQHASTTKHQVQSGGGGAPQGATPPPAPTVLLQQEGTSSPWRTSGVGLLPVVAPTIAVATEKPGCPWRRASDALSGVPGGPEGPWPTLGPHKLQPCLLELCKFFSQCLCRADQPRTPQRRYCDDSDLWYRKHTSELCGRLKRIAFSRNLKQRCLAKMCGRP
ncbi:unnamed protein product [Gadus morhua 'NCC']